MQAHGGMLAPYNVYEIRIENYDDSLRCPPNHTIRTFVPNWILLVCGSHFVVQYR